MTYKEFYQWINDLPSRFENRDLEKYLSALYSQIEKQKTQELTLENLLILLEVAFKSDPLEFNSEWLQISSPPEFDITEIDTSQSLNEEVLFVIDVIKFQISDLHKMRDKQMKNELRYFGTTSETENQWFNFDPFTNLECGAAWFLDGSKNENKEMKVSWKTLGILLEMGRTYE